VFFSEWKSQYQLHRIQALVIRNQIDKGYLDVEEFKFDKEAMVTNLDQWCHQTNQQLRNIQKLLLKV